MSILQSKLEHELDTLDKRCKELEEHCANLNKELALLRNAQADPLIKVPGMHAYIQADMITSVTVKDNTLLITASVYKTPLKVAQDGNTDAEAAAIMLTGILNSRRGWLR
jgi:hypothetical protein